MKVKTKTLETFKLRRTYIALFRVKKKSSSPFASCLLPFALSSVIAKLDATKLIDTNILIYSIDTSLEKIVFHRDSLEILRSTEREIQKGCTFLANF